MKIALLMAVLGISVPAWAATFRLELDPSGAPMCFDEDGRKAPLANCAAQRHYTKVADPSGAPMCFNDAGGKAPLAFCAAPSTLDLLALN